MMVALHALGSAFLTPPGVALVPLVLGLLLAARWPRAGWTLAMLATTLLAALSLPVVSHLLLRRLEHVPALKTLRNGPAAPQAIVVLGGGRYRHAPEYHGRDTVSASTLVRLRYAARLYRRTHLPLLASGGRVFGSGVPEAVLMQGALEHDFSVPVRWTEARSRNTLQNARYSARILHAAHITHVYLVTQAWHMPRALQAFRATGLIVTPAPTAFASTTPSAGGWRIFLPSAFALREDARVFHEYVGMLWYHLGGG